MKNTSELLDLLKAVDQALFMSTVIAAPEATQDLREKLLVKYINPVSHCVHELTKAVKQPA